MQGNGCFKCAKITTPSEFIRRSIEIHGDKYNYDQTEYSRYDIKVKIGCVFHDGEIFEQKPVYHLQGKGCPKCGINLLTTKEFIKRAKEIHGDKYNYDETEYIKGNIKVKIGCLSHNGEIFEQKPTNHLNGSGCRRCATQNKCINNDTKKMPIVTTTEEFIKRAKEIHGDKYNYNETIYVKTNIKVKIGCLFHNGTIFEQTPCSHLQGHGCDKCGSTQKMTNAEFIKRAKEIHCDKYNYELTKYESCDTKVKIKCVFHNGEIFEQVPKAHLNGDGCFKCGRMSKITTASFIEQSKEIHGNKYKYDKTEYSMAKIKVTIGCALHDEYFEQFPSSHLESNNGCYKCARLSFAMTTDKFIKKSKELHGETYDYNKSEYTDDDTNIIITCKSHGDFLIKPYYHMYSKSGCKKCSPPARYSKPQIEWLTFLERELQLPIEHGLNVGEHRISNSLYSADGYNKDLNVIWEHHGCFWHSCKTCFNPSDINKITKTTFQELHDKTMKKKEHCLKEGYKYIEIWGCEWTKIKNSPELLKIYINNLKKELLSVPNNDNIIEQTYNKIILKNTFINAQTKKINNDCEEVYKNYYTINKNTKV